MPSKLAAFALILSLTATALAQQPNTATHSMTINGIDGPPFPINTTLKTSVVAQFSFQTASFQPYAVFQGTLHQGSANFVGGIVDLFVTNPTPVLVIDGWANPAFRTDLSGVGGFGVLVPNAGNPPNGVPIGLQIALQAVVGDPFNSPYGMSLTAATRIVVVQGPIITYYNLGDDGEQPASFPGMPIPFYGSSYTTLYMGSNGYLSFGTTAGSDYTPTDVEFRSGPPRVAPFWADLTCPSNAVKTTFEANPGNGQFGYLRIDYTGVTDLGLGTQHTFGVLLRADGYIEIIEAQNNNPSQYDQITGIGPGGNQGGAQPQKNFVGNQPIGSNVGPGILPGAYVGATNEAFFEWFGIVSQNLYYTNGYDNQFDLMGWTLHFLPNGTGTGAAATTKYVLY